MESTDQPEVSSLTSQKTDDSASGNSPQTGKFGHAALVLYALLRLPALVAAVYLLRHKVFYIIGQLIGEDFTVSYLTHMAIYRISTPLTRTFYVVCLTGLLTLVLIATKRLKPVTEYLLLLSIVFVLVTVSFLYTMTPIGYTLFVLMVLATNLIPEQIMQNTTRYRHMWGGVMALGVGISEFLFFRQYIEWIMRSTGNPRWVGRFTKNRLGAAIPGVLLASFVAAVILNGLALVPYEQNLRMSPVASIVDRGNFNWIDIDRTGRYLYATGHGLEQLRRYDLTDLTAPPMESEVYTGNPQGFCYNPRAGEIYVYNQREQNLLYFDEVTLKLKRTVPIPDISPGDSWIAHEEQTDTIVIASEADMRTGVPFVVIDRVSGAILDTRDIEAGNILVNPQKAIMYLSFFRVDRFFRSHNIIGYDLRRKEIFRSVIADKYLARMEYCEFGNELMVPSPLSSKILRFNGDNLDFLGYIRSMFGIRTLEVDSKRMLLLGGSLVTGNLAVTTLKGGKKIANYYLGPWLRTIRVDSNNGVAYVSSNGFLYKLDYSNRS
jgi:hypothetical protein